MTENIKFWLLDESKWIPYFQRPDKALGPDPSTTGYYLITAYVDHYEYAEDGSCKKYLYTDTELRIAFFQDYGECQGWFMNPDEIKAWYPLVIDGPFEEQQ